MLRREVGDRVEKPRQRRNPFQEAAELENRADRLMQMAANMMAEAMRYDAMAAAIRLETRIETAPHPKRPRIAP